MRDLRKRPRIRGLARAVAGAILLATAVRPLPADSPGLPGPADSSRSPPAWRSENRARLRLTVDAKDRKRSRSPASVVIDFQEALRASGLSGEVDESTVVVLPASSAGPPAAKGGGAGGLPAPAGGDPVRLPHRLDPLFGTRRITLSFVVPDEASRDCLVYFDTVESRRGDPRRFPGQVGDGDLFREDFARREIAPSHFDHLADFDGDGDLDLFQGGVEPFVHCWENVGKNRLVRRGRLASGGVPFRLPSSADGRSWLTVAFNDLDSDGDQDFFPSFNDGPDRGRIVFYRNTTRERGGPVAFARVGPLETVSGVPLAGGPQAGGWFPSIVFVRDWDGKGGVDALVGSGGRCWLYRGLEGKGDGPPRFAGAVAVQAGGQDIALVNPRFDCADLDGDGDLDLLAGTQPGPVLLFVNEGRRGEPRLGAGVTVAFGGKYLIGDAHSGVKAADLDQDGLPDLIAGRFWQRSDLRESDPPRDPGGFWKNVGSPAAPRFERRREGAPYTEEFQPCDALRQNSVRAVDWDGDGRLDLLAGDTDGFVWLFANRGGLEFPVFAEGQRLRAGGQPLSVAGSGGHARLDTTDWDGDGRRDLLVADGGGRLTLFLNRGSGSGPDLAAGQAVQAGGKPVQVGARASVLACDWDQDGQPDVVLAGELGFWFLKNTAAGPPPVLAAPRPVLFGGKPVRYVRPNLGSFADWDGDGKKDLIACHFENTVRFYRNLASGAPGSEPEFADPEGVTILRASSPQMISGVEVVDWNRDGDLDILTGQGHGGSGLRFFERDWVEDELRGTHPTVAVGPPERKPEAPGNR